MDALDPFNVRRRLTQLGDLPGVRSAVSDVSFLLNAREALLPLPLVDRPKRIDPHVFPPLEHRPAQRLRGQRIGVVGSGGSGAGVAMVGVALAFEEAGLRPAAISACSGSAVWGAMWAAGMTAQEMAEFSLSWRPQDYLEMGWTRIPRVALSAARGFTGVAKGEALQRLFDRRLWHMNAGETEIPFHTIVYNLDRGRVEYFGSADTPELMLGELVRIAVALPLLVEAVRVEGHFYVDGGVVDAFPAEPLLDEDADFDRVFGLNVLLPAGLEGEDISGWERKRLGGVMAAGRQLGRASHIELARRAKRRLGDRLTLVEPVDLDEVSGLNFYDLFLDRRRWPELMRRGYEATHAALEPFRTGAGRGRTAGAGA
jgi:NTE family protein